MENCIGTATDQSAPHIYTFALSGTAVLLAGLVSSTCGSQVPARHPGAYAGANRNNMYIKFICFLMVV